MVLWGFRWLKLFLNPFAKDDFGHISESDRRIYMLGRLEDAEFSEWSWVVVVAGVGFFTDAYSIFAINMVLPMIGVIYYDGNMPHSYETAISVVTLGGSIIGQIAFGLGADIWGRRKMYGQELIITIGATLGVVMSSTGNNESMSLIVWLLVWRFVLGIGIGADYPLSAVICSELAPTRLRGKMLTMVFMCQPLGQLAAILVTLIAAVNQHGSVPSDSTLTNCNAECKKTLDSIWRWIIGVGVIPAVIALWFRLTIIESPRYTADVGRDSRKAASELDRYLLEQATAASARTSSDLHQHNGDTHSLRRTSSGVISVVESVHMYRSSSPHEIGRSPLSTGGNQTDDFELQRLPSGAISEAGSVSRNISPANSEMDDNEQKSPDLPPVPSWKDFKQYFWHDGNLRTLMATSLCWFCLDLPFYGLGMNSPRIISVIWYGENAAPGHLYPLTIHNAWQTLVVVSLGGIIGCLITIVAIDKLGRRNIQIIGFFWLFILFIVIGGSFNHLYEIGGSSAIIVLYILCQIFFNFGPNTTTYIMPAELFPTRYRGLCHGISAAFGKLGSVVAQIFLAYIDYGHGINYKSIHKWLPYSLLIFSIFMLLGLLITVKWIPGQEHAPDGKIKTLEQWEAGRQTPNGFSQTVLARFVERIWKVLGRFADMIYLFVDGLAGGEERERRELEREPEGRDQEMTEVHESQRGAVPGMREGDGGVPNGHMNGNTEH